VEKEDSSRGIDRGVGWQLRSMVRRCGRDGMRWRNKKVEASAARRKKVMHGEKEV